VARIVITEFMDDAAVAFLAQRHAVHHDPELADKPSELAGQVVEADALIVRNRTQVRGDLLASAVRLRCVGRLGVGLDNIDMEACAARGIAVHPATGANTVAVAEYVLGAMLLLVRGAFGATQAVADGTWPRMTTIGGELAGRTLGLLGFGATAREVSRRAAAFDMKVQAFDPLIPQDSPAWNLADRVSLERVIETSDVVSLHVPLTQTTRHMIDAATLARMRPGTVLVNAARGGVVDEAAMVEALRSGRLGGAAVDVFVEEPLSPQPGSRFVDVPNLVLTPHVAGLTREANVRVSWVVARAVDATLSGDATPRQDRGT
jgi:(S)-sulfolactate dehydrogenase